MRTTIDLQMKLGQTGIGQINLDPQSRDDIPQLLAGLQYIYCNDDIRAQVFQILDKMIDDGISKENGRPGMSLWNILVMGTIRLNLNCDYDRLQELVNNHKTIRQMLGHGVFDDECNYKLQTIKDNVSLLTLEIMDKINLVVVKEGHRVILNGIKNINPSNDNQEKEDLMVNDSGIDQACSISDNLKENIALKGRCDSFVVETDIHYPTDTNLLYDAIRKIIELTIKLCIKFCLPLSTYKNLSDNLKKIKKTLRFIQKLRSSTSKDEEKKKQRESAIIKAHEDYLDVAHCCIEQVNNIIILLKDETLIPIKKLDEIQKFIVHADRQINLIDRRIIEKEVIPHEEKVFSIFEEHTEWLNKGKIGVPVEFGLKVCIVEDQYGFILNHKTIKKQTDDKYAVEIIQETKKKFENLYSCSFDKGFYTPKNREDLSKELDLVILPKKGRLSQKDHEIESNEVFINARRQHSAVESAINALEVHGLDICPDHGLHGFKRYVALAVAARNIQKLGCIIRSQKSAEITRQKAD